MHLRTQNFGNRVISQVTSFYVLNVAGYILLFKKVVMPRTYLQN